MPSEAGYVSQVAPRAAAAMPLASPDAYGAGFGRAIEGAAAQVHQQQLRAYALDRKATADREMAERSAALATYTVNLRPQLDKLKLDHPRGGAEYEASVHALLAAGRAPLLDGITEDSVSREVSRSLVEHDARVAQEAGEYSLVAGVKGHADDAKQFKNAHVNGIAVAADPAAAFSEMMTQSGGFIGGLSLLNADQQNDLARHLAAAGGAAWIANRAQLHPEEAAALLPRFAGVMTPDQVEDAQQAIQLGQRKQAQEAREAQAAQTRAIADAQKAQRATNADVILRASRGEATVGELATAIRLSRAAGLDPKDITELGIAGEDLGRAGAINAMDNTALRTRVEALRAADAAGTLTDPAQRRDLTHAEAALDARDADTAAHVGTVWRTDPAAAIEQLRALPRTERIEAAARFDPRAGLLASLPHASADLALRGEAIRKARPDAFWPIQSEGAGKGHGDVKIAKQYLRNVLGQDLVNELGASYGTIEGAALDIYTARMAQHGGSGAWSRSDMSAAINEAMGATTRTTGPQRGRVQGGIAKLAPGVVVELPEKWTPLEFGIMYARTDFAALGALGRGGAPAVNADIKAHFRPVVGAEADDGTVTYVFKGPDGRWLQHKNGAPFQLRVAQRGPSAP